MTKRIHDYNVLISSDHNIYPAVYLLFDAMSRQLNMVKAVIKIEQTALCNFYIS